jgi:YesN/AraC family two-component response regulator
MYYNFRRVKLLIKTDKYRESLKILENYSGKNNESLNFHLSYFKAIIYNELNVKDSSLFYSNNYLKLKKKVRSKSNLLKIYAILSNAYNSKKEIDSAYKYSNLTLKELENIKSESNKVFNKIYLEDYAKAKELNNKITETQSESNTKFKIVILVFILVILSFIYLLRKKQLKLIPLKKEYNIDTKLEKEILNGIKALENSKDFLHSYFNINVLAKKLNTNTTYISYIINTTKKQSFKQYITQLRIEYLIKKLRLSSRKHIVYSDIFELHPSLIRS